MLRTELLDFGDDTTFRYLVKRVSKVNAELNQIQFFPNLFIGEILEVLEASNRRFNVLMFRLHCLPQDFVKVFLVDTKQLTVS